MSYYDTAEKVYVQLHDCDSTVVDKAREIAKQIDKRRVIIQSIIGDNGDKDKVTENQWPLLERLTREIMRQEENPPTAGHPEGGKRVRGEVIALFTTQFRGGPKKQNMTIRDDRGFETTGSVPQGLRGSVENGSHVEFVATLKPTPGQFGYGKYTRPMMIPD